MEVDVGELVAVGEVLADADGLAVGDAFLVGVGSVDFTGCGLWVGRPDVVGCTTITLGVGDDWGSRLGLAEGEAFGELRCCVVLSPVCPVFWPAM